VVGPSLTWADAFATAAFAMGHKGLEWVAQFVGYEAIAIDANGGVTTTAGFTHASV
jgi:thiamine biosynthesis lipoprotein